MNRKNSPKKRMAKGTGKGKNPLIRERNVLNALTDALPDAVFLKDRQCRFVWASREHALLLGVKDMRRLMGKTDFDFYPEEVAGPAHAAEQKIMETDRPSAGKPEKQIRRGGKCLWIQTIKIPVHNKHGKVTGLVGIRRDVTAQMKMKGELAFEKFLLHALLDTVPDAIYFKDLESRFLRSSRALANRFGTDDPDRLIGKSDTDFFSREHAEKALRDEQGIIKTGIPLIGIDEKETWPDGHVTWVSTTKMPLKDETGKIVGTFGVSRNVTEQKLTGIELERLAGALTVSNAGLEQANRELRKSQDMLVKANHELFRSNAELEQFASVASHDMQEPLRMVVSYLELISQRYGDRLDPDGIDFIRYAVDGAKRMQRLINNLLDYSRLTKQGSLLESTESEKALRHAVDNLKVAIEESGARVAWDPLPTVRADPGLLERLLQNLVANAVKYRSERPPDVHVSAFKQSTEWVFSIRDNGIGIAAGDCERIFGIFQRLNAKESYSGTGLGLAVCKKIVERHGGRIWVESETGKGSTFFFTIPESGS